MLFEVITNTFYYFEETMEFLNSSSTELSNLYNCIVIVTALSTAINAFTIPFGYTVTMNVYQQRDSLIEEISDLIIIKGGINQDIEIVSVNNITSELEIFNKKMRDSTYGLFFSWFIMLFMSLAGFYLTTLMELNKIENFLKIRVMEIISFKEIIVAFMIICMGVELFFLMKYIYLFSKYHPISKISELKRLKINFDVKKLDINYSIVGGCKIKNEK